MRIPFRQAFWAIVFVSACECGGTTLGEVKCGDDVCSAGREDCSNCPADCGCDADETCASTTKECVPKCGDGVCRAEDDENCSTCVGDCGCGAGSRCDSGTKACVNTCGDGSCLASDGENCGTCAADCGCNEGTTCVGTQCSSDCGNGTCEASLGENCTTCATDCGCTGDRNLCREGACTGCGNGTCQASIGEDCDSCDADCGCSNGFTCDNGSCEATSGCDDAVPCALAIVHATDLKANTGTENAWWPTVAATTGGDVFVGYGRSNVGGGDDDHFSVARLNGSSFQQRTAASTDAYTSGNRILIQTGTSRITALFDRTGGGSHVMATRSTDGGGTWSPLVQVDQSAISENGSDVAAAFESGVLHVAYRGRATGVSTSSPYEVFYQQSEDGGATWTTPLRLSNDTDQDDKVGVAVSGQNVVVAWVTFDGDVRVARSNNGGRVFSSQRTVNDVAGKAENFSRHMVAIRGSTVHLVWSDTRDDTDGDIFMDTSTDGGLTWGTDVELPDASTRQDESPEVRFAPDGRAWVVWQRATSGDGDDVFAAATRDGTCFCSPVRINRGVADDQSNASFAIDSSGKLHVAWRAEDPDADWGIGYNAASPQ